MYFCKTYFLYGKMAMTVGNNINCLPDISYPMQKHYWVEILQLFSTNDAMHHLH
jgi:hypothetical protein